MFCPSRLFISLLFALKCQCYIETHIAFYNLILHVELLIQLGYSAQYSVYICPMYCECVVFPSLNVANVSGGRILRRNPDESLKSFPPCYSHSTLQLSLEISISSHSRNLLTESTVQLLYTVKEKRGNLIENSTPFPMVYENHTEILSMRTLNIMPRNLNKVVRS
jgi:hypothetical protein